jgi:hypothetical protein
MYFLSLNKSVFTLHTDNVHHVIDDPAGSNGKKRLPFDFARYFESFVVVERYFDLRRVN